MRLIYSSLSKFCTPSTYTRNSKKIPKLHQRLKEFDQLVDEFVDNQEKYQAHMSASIGKYHNLDHLAWFARSALICHRKINIEDSFRTVKMHLLREEGNLTPHSCTLLMEALTHFKFEGDENRILAKLCNYYEKMGFLFSEQEERSFWKNYIRIMGKKAHTTVKFKNLERRNMEDLEDMQNI